MKRMSFACLTLLLLFFDAIAVAALDPITDTVRCQKDPSQSYALYVPPTGSKQSLPVIYFFDPHGAGAFPLHKYKTLADANGFILVGSNNSKNGNEWSTTDKIWKTLLEDTRQRLKIENNRIYTCGFSGGAKVASYIAIQYPGIKGVIAGGAGLPDGVSAGDLPFSFTALAGEGDMNMTDLVALNNELDQSRTRHRLLLFDGKHEWAPIDVMRIAFTGLQFDAMLGGQLVKNQDAIDRYVAASKHRVEEDLKKNALLSAGAECSISVHLLEGLSTETGWFRNKAASLATTPPYRQQEQARQDLLAREQQAKAAFAEHFQQDDKEYWLQTIDALRVKAGRQTPDRGMYQRLLAYLSLAFYSISNRLITGGDNDPAAVRFVNLYKLADPTNSEAWYFSALLHARAREAKAAEKDLGSAIQYGFKDRIRLKQQPEFQKVFGAAGFSRIAAKMAK